MLPDRVLRIYIDGAEVQWKTFPPVKALFQQIWIRRFKHIPLRCWSIPCATHPLLLRLLLIAVPGIRHAWSLLLVFAQIGLPAFVRESSQEDARCSGGLNQNAYLQIRTRVGDKLIRERQKSGQEYDSWGGSRRLQPRMM